MWRMSVVFPEPGVPTTRNRRLGGAFSSASLPRSLATVVADDAAVDLEAAPLLASEEREVPRSSLGVLGDAAEASGWVVLELVQPMARVTARVALIRRLPSSELVREVTPDLAASRGMRRASLVLLAAFPAVHAAPTGRTERGLALLDELEADVHALDAQLSRSTSHGASHRGALGGLERRMDAADTSAQAIARPLVDAYNTFSDKVTKLTASERKEVGDAVAEEGVPSGLFAGPLN